MSIVSPCMILSLAGVLVAAQPAFADQASLEASNAAAHKIGDLEQQLKKLDLNAVFTAAALTSDARRAQGRLTLERLRSLTAQRRAAARPQSPEGQRVHDELHAARINVADAGEAVLAWAAEQQGSMRLENSRLRMQSPAQQRQFNELFALLEAAMARHDKAVDASEAYRKANMGRLVPQHIPAQGKPTRF